MVDRAAAIEDGAASFWRRFWPRPFEASVGTLVGLGVVLAIAYLLLHAAFDGLVLSIWGFPRAEQPFWQSNQWLTEIVNAALIGYLPAAQAIARRGVARDLAELRPRLRRSGPDFDALFETAVGQGGRLARALGLSGVAIGALLTFADPSMSAGATRSLADPWFLWALGRSMLTAWLIARFFVYDFEVTRLFVGLGRDGVRIDLLDLRALAPFARRGQRSALSWVLFSSLFSLFWLGDWAARANLPFLVVALSMATFAFVGPLVALRSAIRTRKLAELDRLREEIREARGTTGVADGSPALANAVGYYQLIEGVREWPIDAANVLKFAGYLLLGLGSWVGGALVERILDTAMRG
jgi:hypothetical protein